MQYQQNGSSLLNHLRVDAGRGVGLQVARHGVERDVEEVHRVALALLRLAEPNHPPSQTSQHTVSEISGIRRSDGGWSLPGGDEQGPLGLRRAAAEGDGGGAVHAHQLLA